MRALVLLLVLALPACALPRIEPDGPLLTARAPVVWHGLAPDPRLVRVINEAELLYRAAWRTGPLDVGLIVVYPGEILPCLVQGQEAYAAADCDSRVLYLCERSLWAVVHELHHLGRGGKGHSNGSSYRLAEQLGRRLVTSLSDSKSRLSEHEVISD
jgi:hypothetical protein